MQSWSLGCDRGGVAGDDQLEASPGMFQNVEHAKELAVQEPLKYFKQENGLIRVVTQKAF